MARKLTFDTLPELRAAIALVANSGASARVQLSRVQSLITDNADVAMLAGLPAGQYRKGLTLAMVAHQTRDGRRYPSCILCREPVSNDNGRNFPSAEQLVTLVASSLLADTETLSEVSPGSAPRLGWVPGNIALACKACAIWKSSNDGRDVVLSPDVIDASLVLMSWAGIKAHKPVHAPDHLESLTRRAAARDRALGRA